MQHVSDGYREAMQLPIRNRGYIRVLLAAYNPNTQNNAFYEGGSSLLWYSNPTHLFDPTPTGQHYATLENKWTRVDGTMFFAPEASGARFTSIESSAIVTDELVSSSATVAVSYPADPDLTDITIDFDGNAPRRVTLTFSSGVGVDFVAPITTNRVKFKSERMFKNTTGFTLTASSMSASNTRLRIGGIYLGKVLSFSNNEVTDSTVTQHVSPLAEDCPTIDAMIKVADYDDFLNPDNPDSAAHFFKQGQMMYVAYGYELITPDYSNQNKAAVEWVPGWKLELDKWSYANNQAILYGVDILRHLTAKYESGQYQTGIYYSALLGEVRMAAGLPSTAINTDGWRGTTLSANGAIVPVVPYREAFQILANATLSTLLIARNGRLVYRDLPALGNIIPDEFTMQTDDLYSNAKMEYPSQVKDLCVEDGTWYPGDDITAVVNITQTFTEGESYIFSWSEPMYITDATLDGEPLYLSGLTQDYLGTHEIQITATSTVTGTLVITGKPLLWLPSNYTFALADTGYTEIWSLPLGHNTARIKTLLHQRLVGDNYLNNPVYVGEMRGFPELDAGDVIYLEDRFRPNLRIWLTDVSLRFNGAFRGTFTGRWVGDDSGMV